MALSDTVDLSTMSTYMRACDFQIIASLIPMVRILKTRRTSGFSGDSQLLYILGFILKYIHYPVAKTDTSDDLMTMYIIHYWIRVALTIISIITFLVSFNVPQYFEEETDKSWLIGGIIASFVLAADFADYDRSRFTTLVCTFGSYLDLISWIPQFKLNLKKMCIDEWTAIYVGCLYAYDFINMSNVNHDYYLILMNRDMRLKHSLLKFFLLFGFLIKYFRRGLSMRIESANEINIESSVVNEVIVVSSAEEYSDKMLFRTLGMEDVLVHRKLMLPY